MIRLRSAGVLGATLCLATLLGVAEAHAQSQVTGPIVTLDRYEVSPGEPVVLTIDGFDAAGVTITVCGNEARRGSSDCNMTQSEGKGLRPAGTSTLAQMPVYAPPVPCPCVIRVSTSNNDQVAVAPITLVGHPVAPVVNASGSTRVPLDVSIVANESSGGLSDALRSSLGGSSTYDVTVTVRNRSTFTVDQVTLSGSAGRSVTEELITLELPDPGAVAGGATWQETVTAELPSLTFGDIEWQATASGEGLSVQATDTTSDLPLLLILLGVLLFIDLLVLFLRMLTRGRRRDRQGPDDNPFIDDPHGFEASGRGEAERAARDREPYLVG